LNEPNLRPGTVEVWVQPLGTAVFAPGGRAYVSGGATVTVAPKWDLTLGVAFTIADSGTDDGSQTWQVGPWLAATRFFGVPGLTPGGLVGSRTGFFIGPKLLASVAHLTSCSRCLGGDRYPPVTSLALEVGFEGGFRLQLAHFDLSLMLPSFTIGYGWNDAFDSPYHNLGFFGGSPAPGVRGLTLSADLNLLRAGISF
jgi:hypothetical protein